MKKLLCILIFIAGIAKGQPQLSITGYSSYSQTSVPGYALITFYDVDVYNADSVSTFHDTLSVMFGVEDPPGTVTPVSAMIHGYDSIAPISTLTLDSAYFYVDTAFLKEGNNTVVIWPIGSWATSWATLDSLYIELWIEIDGQTGTAIDDATDVLSLKIGPNPANSIIRVYDPENSVIDLRVSTLEGKRIQVPLNEKTLDVTKLPEGIYVLEMYTSKGIISRKLVIQK